jgi:hypothetical protein
VIFEGILNYEKGKKRKAENLTFRKKEVRVTLRITESKCLDNSINLLGFTGKAYFHEQSPQCDIKGNAKKVELIDV